MSDGQRLFIAVHPSRGGDWRDISEHAKGLYEKAATQVLAPSDARISALEKERDELQRALEQATSLLYSHGMEADRDVYPEDGIEYAAWLRKTAESGEGGR